MDDREGVVYVTHYAEGVRNFSIAFDTQTCQPLWVAAPMHKWYREPRNTSRTDRWAYDPKISREAQPNLKRAYRPVGEHGNYSRGHLVASADRLRERALNEQTFYHTNMSPQIQNGFNAGIWSDLEERVQRWGDECADTLYVVTGVAFIGIADSVSNSVLEFRRVTADNSGREIPVPSHFYKVLLSSRSGDTGRGVGELEACELRAVGFLLEHKAARHKVSAADMMSVAQIEDMVGVEFFPMLSDEAIKENFNVEDWAL